MRQLEHQIHKIRVLKEREQLQDGRMLEPGMNSDFLAHSFGHIVCLHKLLINLEVDGGLVGDFLEIRDSPF
jgi:hypothetical protein